MKTIEYQPELEGKRVQFQYKENDNQRKWRNGFVTLSYSPVCYDYGFNLQQQENFALARFIEYEG